jgi:predicted GH43/DUF377 family glycosyl hydrolase
LKLSTGDYIFFYNSANESSVYRPGYVILDGSDPTVIKDRSTKPLLTPLFDWEVGSGVYPCNVPNVIFLEAARSLGGDIFQVYFGGNDANVGTAIVKVTITNINDASVSSSHSVMIASTQ